MTISAQKFREVVFQLLYSYDIGRATDEHMLDMLTKELEVTKKVVREAQARMQLILSHQDEIDTLIAKTSHAYAFERIQSVERNILRLGSFELLYERSIPSGIVMAEAMRLARKFSTKESASFVNAILNAIYKSSPGKQVDPAPLTQTALELSQSEKIAQEAALDKNQKKSKQIDES